MQAVGFTHHFQEALLGKALTRWPWHHEILRNHKVVAKACIKLFSKSFSVRLSWQKPPPLLALCEQPASCQDVIWAWYPGSVKPANRLFRQS